MSNTTLFLQENTTLGYTKIVQWADYTEIFNYQKNVHKKHATTRRRKTKFEDNKPNMRSEFSAKRAKKRFLRAIEANVYTKGEFEFLTLTNYKEVSLSLGYAYLRNFFKNLKQYFGKIAYYGVPEWQKSGRLHFHCAVWGIPKKFTKDERTTRFLQRQWARGYLDVRGSKHSSNVYCRYMAKYMSKSYTDTRLSGRRAYTSSYNVERVLQAGSNTMSSHLDMIIPLDKNIIKNYTYNTQFLGECEYLLIKRN